MRRSLLIVALTAAAMCFASASRSVWDGVYTRDQAARGKALYGEECMKCHAQNLMGGEAAPPLAGEDFVRKWNGSSVGALYESTRKTMPSDDPGSLSTRQYADLVAYLLNANDFPAGPRNWSATPLR